MIIINGGELCLNCIQNKLTSKLLTTKREKVLEHLDLGKDKTQELMAKTLGYDNVEKMITKFKEVLNKLEEGASNV